MSKDNREKIRNDIEKVFADVAGLEPEQHKNVLGDKWKFINAVVEYVVLFPGIEEAKREGIETAIRQFEDNRHWQRGEWCFSPITYSLMMQALKGD